MGISKCGACTINFNINIQESIVTSRSNIQTTSKTSHPPNDMDVMLRHQFSSQPYTILSRHYVGDIIHIFSHLRHLMRIEDVHVEWDGDDAWEQDETRIKTNNKRKGNSIQQSKLKKTAEKT